MITFNYLNDNIELIVINWVNSYYFWYTVIINYLWPNISTINSSFIQLYFSWEFHRVLLCDIYCVIVHSSCCLYLCIFCYWFFIVCFSFIIFVFLNIDFTSQLYFFFNPVWQLLKKLDWYIVRIELIYLNYITYKQTCISSK